MPILIYNSLTGNKEEFKPLEKDLVKMYVCGPTVYDEPHLGHLRSAYVFEVVRNYFQTSGYQVRFVRNVTDVDDKIIDKARREGSADLVDEAKKISEKYHRLYSEDLKKLGIKTPTVEPFATGHLLEMQAIIERLIEKGMAYVTGSDVYFSVSAFEAYGKLSGQKKEAMLEGVRKDSKENKRDPLDFALWKQSKKGEPSWESPWGRGRPGWHIECSAMSMKYLGETFDIHGGGRDLIFPHHENEIAQSEACTGKTFARIWMHHGLVTVNGQKMSKSLKNFVTLRDLEKISPARLEELKFLFLGTHYAMPMDYSDASMEMAGASRKRIINFLIDVKDNAAAADKDESPKIKEFEQRFREAMDDDFNTAKALAVLHDMATFGRDPKNQSLRALLASKIKEYAGIFCLSLEEEKADDEKTALIRQWTEARQGKDYKRADMIRDEFLKKYKFYLSVDKSGKISLRET